MISGSLQHSLKFFARMGKRRNLTSQIIQQRNQFSGRVLLGFAFCTKSPDKQGCVEKKYHLPVGFFDSVEIGTH